MNEAIYIIYYFINQLAICELIIYNWAHFYITLLTNDMKTNNI